MQHTRHSLKIINKKNKKRLRSSFGRWFRSNLPRLNNFLPPSVFINAVMQNLESVEKNLSLQDSSVSHLQQLGELSSAAAPGLKVCEEPTSKTIKLMDMSIPKVNVPSENNNCLFACIALGLHLPHLKEDKIKLRAENFQELKNKKKEYTEYYFNNDENYSWVSLVKANIEAKNAIARGIKNLLPGSGLENLYHANVDYFSSSDFNDLYEKYAQKRSDEIGKLLVNDVNCRQAWVKFGGAYDKWIKFLNSPQEAPISINDPSTEIEKDLYPPLSMSEIKPLAEKLNFSLKVYSSLELDDSGEPIIPPSEYPFNAINTYSIPVYLSPTEGHYYLLLSTPGINESYILEQANSAETGILATSITHLEQDNIVSSSLTRLDSTCQEITRELTLDLSKHTNNRNLFFSLKPIPKTELDNKKLSYVEEFLIQGTQNVISKFTSTKPQSSMLENRDMIMAYNMQNEEIEDYLIEIHEMKYTTTALSL